MVCLNVSGVPAAAYMYGGKLALIVKKTILEIGIILDGNDYGDSCGSSEASSDSSSICPGRSYNYIIDHQMQS